MNKKGFTLLEMTIVILIISILFLLVIPNIKKTLTIVNDKGCKALEKIADSAIIQYKLEYDSYPGSVSDLVNVCTSFCDIGIYDVITNEHTYTRY